jgi:hypothetical protein
MFNSLEVKVLFTSPYPEEVVWKKSVRLLFLAIQEKTPALIHV